MENAQTVVDEDLEYICHKLEKEFAALPGKNILITGGGGFLGYYLIQSLLRWNRTAGENGVRVTVYDNYVHGLPQWLSSLSGDPNLRLVKHDITRPLPEDIDDFHYIIHVASIASPMYYRKYPIETMDANVNGLRTLLEYCRRQKESEKPVDGFLFYSSSEIYGDPTPENIPTPETYRGNVSCTGHRACYDESKRYGETLCVNFARQYDLPIGIARPFNNYGPGLKITDRRVIPDFVRDILDGRDIVLHSDGSPTRTFCYIADAIVGYFKILIRGRRGEAYNIGVESPEMSIADFARKLGAIAGELFGYQGKVVHKPGSDETSLVERPNRCRPLIEKARKELGYDPSVSLEEGIRRSLIWYRDNRDAEEA